MVKMLEELRQTHNPQKLWASFILFILFGTFLFSGIIFGVLSYMRSQNTMTNNNLKSMTTNSTITAPTEQTKTGQTEFTLPRLRFANGNGPTSYSAYVNCSVSGTFVQNSPSNITVEVILPVITQVDLNVTDIQVSPVDAPEVYRDWTSQTGYSSYGPSVDFLPLWQTESYGANQVWTSLLNGVAYWNTFCFEDVGLINLKITIYAKPTNFALNYTDWSAYNSNYVPFVTTVAVPNTFMDSIETVQLQQSQQAWQQSIQSIENQSLVLQLQWNKQQEISGDATFSLTFFVLAFMSLDLAIVVFDHSEDKKRKAEYESKQTNKTNENILKTPEYAV